MQQHRLFTGSCPVAAAQLLLKRWPVATAEAKAEARANAKAKAEAGAKAKSKRETPEDRCI